MGFWMEVVLKYQREAAVGYWLPAVGFGSPRFTAVHRGSPRVDLMTIANTNS